MVMIRDIAAVNAAPRHVCRRCCEQCCGACWGLNDHDLTCSWIQESAASNAFNGFCARTCNVIKIARDVATSVVDEHDLRRDGVCNTKCIQWIARQDACAVNIARNVATRVGGLDDHG